MDVKQSLVDAIIVNDKTRFAEILEDPENVKQLDQKKIESLLTIVTGKIQFESIEYETYGINLINVIHPPIYVKQRQIESFCRADAPILLARALEKMDVSDPIELLSTLVSCLHEAFLVDKNFSSTFACSNAIVDFIASKKSEYSRNELDAQISEFYWDFFQYGNGHLILNFLTHFPAIDFSITEELTLNTPELVHLISTNENLNEEQKREIFQLIDESSEIANHVLETLRNELYNSDELIYYIDVNRDKLNYHFLETLYRNSDGTTRHFFREYQDDTEFIPPKLTNNMTIPKLAHQEAYLLSLTKAERELLVFYTTGKLDSANKAIFKTPERYCDELCHKVREIQRIISHAPPVSEEFIVYRGGTEDYNAFPGRAIVSTTTDVQVMFEFSKNKFGYKLHIKPGMRILPMYMISSLEHEYEILIDGELSEFEYVNGEYATRGKVTIVLYTLDVFPKENIRTIEY